MIGGSDRAAQAPPSDSTRRNPPSLISYEAARTPPSKRRGQAAARWNREDQSSSTAQPCPVTRLLRSAALCSSVWEILERPRSVRDNIRVVMPARCKNCVSHWQTQESMSPTKQTRIVATIPVHVRSFFSYNASWLTILILYWGSLGTTSTKP